MDNTETYNNVCITEHKTQNEQQQRKQKPQHKKPEVELCVRQQSTGLVSYKTPAVLLTYFQGW